MIDNSSSSFLNSYYVPGTILTALMWVGFFFFLSFWATLRGMWDLSSMTRGGTHVTCLDWTAREVPILTALNAVAHLILKAIL